ncbi:hypothetical protein [Neptunicella marina]|uniref:Uncharacterized protein n=1 Tax=Neptunicella marina TaxID=2125989 RepID=A0A8J6IR72_9ALTE|nr:hypothetical protein [Neptunicella marina]MBC3764944.1 hypothetical protein [Neptunicella marina]
MNKKLFVILTSWGLSLMLLSILFNTQQYKIPLSEAARSEMNLTHKYDIDWKAILNEVAQFKTISQVDKIDEKPIAVKAKISDSRIIAIVADTKRSISILKAKEQNVITLGVGDSWLTPWVLQDIFPDRVVWFNSENNETFEQFIFESVPIPTKSSSKKKRGQ